jgi:hypothetical protein
VRWSLTADQTVACLHHPKGFVREAVLSYLKMASPRALLKLLPTLQSDPDPLVASQVEQIVKEVSGNTNSATRSLKPGNNGNGLPDQPGWEPI